MPYWDFGEEDYPSYGSYGDSGGMGFNFDFPTGVSPLTMQATTNSGRQNFGIPEYDYAPLNKYNSYLESMPQRGDNKLGFWQNLAALGASGIQGWQAKNPAAGIELYSDLRDAPYKQAYGDWARKEPMLKAGVDKANASYDREIKKAQAQRQYEKDQNEYNLNAVKTGAQIKRWLDQSENDAQRIDIAKNQVANGRKSVTGSDGMLYLIDTDGQPIQTGIKTNSLTLEDRKALQSNQGNITARNQSALEGQRFTNDQALEDQRQKGRLELDKQRTEGRIEVNQNRPYLKTASPQMQEKARQNAMARLWEANPQEVEKYFTRDAKGNMVMDPDKIAADKAGWDALIDRRDAFAEQELTPVKPKSQDGYRQVTPPQAGDMGRFKVTKRPRQ